MSNFPLVALFSCSEGDDDDVVDGVNVVAMTNKYIGKRLNNYVDVNFHNIE